MTDPAADTLLLDTHAWVWLVEGNADRLGAMTRSMLSKDGPDGRLRVPAISVWEVGMLVVKGRLRLTLPRAQWVRRALSAPGIALALLTS